MDFENDLSIGIPGSHLDNKVFYSQASFLEDAPYMNTLVHNPNHIGCHTVGDSEEFFEGTHEIEREAILSKGGLITEVNGTLNHKN